MKARAVVVVPALTLVALGLVALVTGEGARARQDPVGPASRPRSVARPERAAPRDLALAPLAPLSPLSPLGPLVKSATRPGAVAAVVPVPAKLLPPYRPPVLGAGRHGEGEVILFQEIGRTKEERRAHEAEREALWRDVLALENELLLTLAKERLDVTAETLAAVKRALDERAEATSALVARVRDGELPVAAMDDHVERIEARAEARLVAALGVEKHAQLAALDPRDALEDEE